MDTERRPLRPVVQVLVPDVEVSEAQSAERFVQVHLQASRIIGQLADGRRIIRRGPNEKRVVASRALFRQFLHLQEGFFVDNGRIGVGHGQNKSDAPSKSRCRARRIILFVRGSWLAHVHMSIDETRKFEDVS